MCNVTTIRAWRATFRVCRDLRSSPLRSPRSTHMRTRRIASHTQSSLLSVLRLISSSHTHALFSFSQQLDATCLFDSPSAPLQRCARSGSGTLRSLTMVLSSCLKRAFAVFLVSCCYTQFFFCTTSRLRSALATAGAGQLGVSIVDSRPFIVWSTPNSTQLWFGDCLGMQCSSRAFAPVEVGAQVSFPAVIMGSDSLPFVVLRVGSSNASSPRRSARASGSLCY